MKQQMSYSCTPNLQPAEFGNTSYTSELFNQTQNMFHYTGNFLPHFSSPNTHEQVPFSMKVEPITPASSTPSSPQPVTENQPVKKKKRPGREPAIADNEISPEELMKRNQRRERNRCAAAKCRQKRAVRAESLEAGNLRLTRENQRLFEDNQALLAQNALLQKKLAANSQTPPPYEPYLDSSWIKLTPPVSNSSIPTIESNLDHVFNSFTMPFEPTHMINNQGRSFST
jgi:hypothetical protein